MSNIAKVPRASEHTQFPDGRLVVGTRGLKVLPENVYLFPEDSLASWDDEGPSLLSSNIKDFMSMKPENPWQENFQKEVPTRLISSREYFIELLFSDP